MLTDCIPAPTQGEKDFNFTTTTKKITDWDIPATLNLTSVVTSYFR